MHVRDVDRRSRGNETVKHVTNGIKKNNKNRKSQTGVPEREEGEESNRQALIQSGCMFQHQAFDVCCRKEEEEDKRQTSRCPHTLLPLFPGSQSCA